MTTAATRPADFLNAAFEALAGRVRSVRHRRAQHVALRSLLELDAHRLDDIGLNVRDVMDALAARGR
jgi:uncharacterized protein YjiS (DUF1127 family)